MNLFQWLAHKLFGWDYVFMDAKTLRVRSDKQGVAYCLHRPGYSYNTICIDPTKRHASDVLWLTCPRHKYTRFVE